MTGRPTIRTETMVDDIVDRLTAGEPLAKILRDDGMPAPTTFYRWLDEDGDLSARVARAREHGADAIAVDALEISDEREGKAIMADGREVGVVFDSTAVQRNKLRVDTRLKLLRCWDPKRYGDRLEVDNKGEIAINVAVRRFAEPGKDDPDESESA